MNAHSDNSFTFIILEDYIMALISTMTVDCICMYVFDSHP